MPIERIALQSMRVVPRKQTFRPLMDERLFFIGGDKMNTCAQMADLLFPNVSKLDDEIIALYPPRSLPAGAMVTRLAPSPTGELHVGTLYAAFLSYRLAKQSRGVFYVRLDDTDQKREVDGASDRIPTELRRFGIAYEEGFFHKGSEFGEYGPYIQSRRKEIYQVFAKRLVYEGKAYPCFCSEEALDEMRAEQKRMGVDIGYYSDWAVHRNIELDEIKREMDLGKKFTLRLRSPGDLIRKVCLYDLFKGSISMPENVQDIVLLKSDGLPTYHFAHVIDDFLMRTTHVLRGDEWLSSYPIHRQLFEVFGWEPPVYGHLAPIMKKEGTSKRKFSKRKDKDGHAAYYRALGIPPLALREYYMRLINSSYEDWRRANPTLALEEYAIDLHNLGSSGPVFDMEKLNDIAKDIIAAMDANSVFAVLIAWAKEFDPAFYEVLCHDQPYALKVLGIGRGINKPRKDISKWSEVRSLLGYFWDTFFKVDPSQFTHGMHEAALLQTYAKEYEPEQTKEDWYSHLKAMAERIGFTSDKKAFAKDPATYKGTLADAASILRYALTGREKSPDLYDIMQVMGQKRVLDRLTQAAEICKL
jgi:glutamyl-tRNA synthetase